MSDVSRYCVECERLQAENQRLCADVLSLMAERDELIRRRDGYRAALELERAERMAAEAERDRYRAALERIAVDHISISRNAAKRALNGGDDE